MKMASNNEDEEALQASISVPTNPESRKHATSSFNFNCKSRATRNCQPKRTKENTKKTLASVPELTAGQARWVHYSKNKREVDVKEEDDFATDEEGFDTPITNEFRSIEKVPPQSMKRMYGGYSVEEDGSEHSARNSASSLQMTDLPGNCALARAVPVTPVTSIDDDDDDDDDDDSVLEEPPIERESGSARSIVDFPRQNIVSNIPDMSAARGSSQAENRRTVDLDGMSVITGLSQAETLQIRNTDDLDGMSIMTGISTAETLQIRNTADVDGRSAMTTHSATTEVVRNSAVAKLNRPSSHAPPSVVAPISSTDSMHAALTKRRRTSVMLLPVDAHGTAISEAVLKEQWERAGKCTECGQIQTHLKVKHGFLNMFRKLEPRTVHRKVYKGVCLLCHDVEEVRAILNDDTIPLDLPRASPGDEMTASLRSLLSGIYPDGVAPVTAKKSPIGMICGSWKAQVCLLVSFVLALGVGVGVAILLSIGPKEFIPPPPTSMPSSSPSTSFPSAAPTSLEWVLVGEVVGDTTESFAYSIESNEEGTVMAVASPWAQGRRGQVDVYSLVSEKTDVFDDGFEKWVKQGSSRIGDNILDQMGMGMDLSGDGKTLAIGSPGNGNGFVRVFRFYEEDWVQIGQNLIGPSVNSSFGFSVALDKSGTRLAVGAPQHRDGSGFEVGYAQVYSFTGSEWSPFAQELTPEYEGSRFGHAVSINEDGSVLLVGAPEDDSRWENGGQVYAYMYHSDAAALGWALFVTDGILGDDVGARFGSKIKVCAVGDAFVSPENTAEDGGLVRVVGFDSDWGSANDAGFPVLGDSGSGLGANVDVDYSANHFVASTRNVNGESGLVRVFAFGGGEWEEGSDGLPPLPLGNVTWFGDGPSVNMLQSDRIVVGYESVMMDGESKSLVRFFEFMGTRANFPQRRNLRK